MTFLKSHILLLTISLFVVSIASSQDCSTETYEFNNGDGCDPGQWNWSGTSVPSSAEGGLCMEFGDGTGGGCFTAINNDGLMTDMTCNFCFDFAYKVDISGDVSLPITADGFTFSLTNMASTTGGGGRCNETGCSDWSPSCGAGGFIGYNGIKYETIEESLLFEFDLYDNNDSEAPASCDEHLAIIDIDGNTATETILQSSCIESFNLEDGLSHNISICYDASATQITVSIDGTTATTYNIDLSTYFTTEDCPTPSEVNVYPVFTSGWEPGVIGQLCDISNVVVGVEEKNLPSILTLYPNPVSETLTISSTKLLNKIKILDLSGKVIVNENDLSGNETKLDLTLLPKGVYSVVISFKDNSKEVRKITK